MGRKKVLEKRLQRLQNKKNQLVERSKAADITVDELRSINTQVAELNEDIQDVQEELAAIEEEERGANPQAQVSGQTTQQNTQQRSVDDPTQVPANAQRQGFTPVASFQQNTQQRSAEPYSSLEYRQAFMNYVQRGTPIPQDVITRAGGDSGTTVAADLGMIIPSTIMNEFIKEVSKVYGQVYSKVRKLNIKGGVKFPISKLKAKFSWITETTVSGKQKAGEIKEYIEFSYNIGEIRVAETLLAQVITLDLFEQEIVRIMVEAYVETMDKVIINGTGTGQPLGILQDPRVTNVIEFTAAEFADWTAWRKKLFAKLPLSKRAQGEFLFTAATVEANLLTMKDANNRPLFKEATDGSFSNTSLAGRFYGRDVTMVEPDIVADFETAESGDVVGLYWVPTDYAINTNLQFGMKRYFDEDTNEWINKGLTIVDGKMLDVSGCYVIKKK
jgi:HK97 family phage major capsid protein